MLGEAYEPGKCLKLSPNYPHSVMLVKLSPLIPAVIAMLPILTSVKFITIEYQKLSPVCTDGVILIKFMTVEMAGCHDTVQSVKLSV